MNLGKGSCPDCFWIKRLKSIFYRTFVVFFKTNLYLVERKLLCTVLQLTQFFSVLLGNHPLESTNVLASLEVNAATVLNKSEYFFCTALVTELTSFNILLRRIGKCFQ